MQESASKLNIRAIPQKAVKRSRGMTRADRARLATGWLFVSPWIAGFSIFLLYPILASLYYSLCEFSVLQPARFIGLGNYADLFADDVFLLALKNTFLYAAVALPL